MKLLMVAPLPPPYGGIANWTLLMQHQLHRDPDILLTEILNTSPHKRELDGRTLWDRVVIQGLDMFRLRRELKRMCRTGNPDVIHMTTSGSLALIRDILLMKAAKKMGIPVVYHIHFGRVPEISAANTREWRMMKRSIDLSSATIAIDRSTYQVLLRDFGAEKIYNIPNPFDLSAVCPGLESVKKEVVFLGWCVKTKGVEELLTAWDTLSPRYPHWVLRLVGPCDREYRKKLESDHDTRQVIFDGEHPHEQALSRLDAAAIFTLPSYTEGFPNAVLEAMAYGKPIVATAVGAIPQMLREGGGIVIPPRNSEALTQALGELMGNEKSRGSCGEKARQALENTYEIQKIMGQYRAVWNAQIREEP